MINKNYSKRVSKVPKSFVREILKVTEKPEVISFAGGLPNPNFFPVEDIEKATSKVLTSDGEKVLQYSTTEGFLPLREFIAKRYYSESDVTADNIVITSGSQQALDLIAKVFLDANDNVMIERPGYLGAIQSFSMYEPNFVTVGINNEGVILDEFEKKIKEDNPKLFYAVTNYQNPTGISYSNDNRKAITEILKNSNTIMIDDNPYGELSFYSHPNIPMKQLLGDQCISLGSFSKVFAPAMRLGWVCADRDIIDKIVTMKQASDLHTNYFSQRILYQYLNDCNIDQHIAKIREAYKVRRDYMLKMIKEYIPSEVKYTEPDGGMFLWMELPDYIDVMNLFEIANGKNVAFVPGAPFYVSDDENPNSTLRLNYTNSEFEEIERGISALGEAIASFI